jgi:hypothetical protein
MKKIIFSTFLVTMMMSCSSSDTKETTSETSTETQTTIVNDFLKNTKSIGQSSSKQPIVDFKNQADKQSAKKMDFNKNSFSEMLSVAKKFKTLVIVVGDHTIVKVKDVNNCNDSASWGACMPYGEGYIKKGSLNYDENYINYIIGKPDGQERIAYFFN